MWRVEVPGIFHDIKLHTRVYQCLSKCKIGFSYNLETRFAFRQYMCGRGQGKWEGIGRVNVKYESHQQWRLSITTLLDHTNKKNTRKMKSYNILWLRYPSEIYKSVNALSPQIIKLHKCPRRSLTTNTGSYTNVLDDRWLQISGVTQMSSTIADYKYRERRIIQSGIHNTK